jgi:hypothetical protein
LLQAPLVSKLVTANQPPQALIMGVSLVNSDCSMDAV